MDASEQAKRILGAQVCRALMASAVEVKKKGAVEIEMMVNLCLQRDERSAMHALESILQTLESEFLRVRCEPGNGVTSLPGAGENISLEIGGMMALLATVRAHAPLGQRTLAALLEVHRRSKDFTLLYYASECVYNVMLCADAAQMPLDFSALFAVLTNLWELGNETEPSLSKARVILDKEIKRWATRQSIDVRELVLGAPALELWLSKYPQNLVPWFELIVENNDDNGMAKLCPLLEFVHRLRAVLPDQEEYFDQQCVRIGGLISRDRAEESAANEIVEFYGDGTSSRLKVLSNVGKGLINGLHNGPESLVEWTCYTLCAPEFDAQLSSKPLDAELKSKWISTLFNSAAPIELSEAAWRLVMPHLATDGRSSECISALTRRLLRSDTDMSSLEQYAPQLSANSEIWTHLLEPTTPVTIGVCQKLKSLLAIIPEPEQAVRQIAALCESRSDAASLETYLVYLLLLDFYPLKSVRGLNWVSETLVQSCAPAKDQESMNSGSSNRVDATVSVKGTASSVHDGAEALIYLMERPEAMRLRTSCNYAGLCADLCRLLSSESRYYATALQRREEASGLAPLARGSHVRLALKLQPPAKPGRAAVELAWLQERIEAKGAKAEKGAEPLRVSPPVRCANDLKQIEDTAVSPERPVVGPRSSTPDSSPGAAHGNSVASTTGPLSEPLRELGVAASKSNFVLEAPPANVNCEVTDDYGLANDEFFPRT